MSKETPKEGPIPIGEGLFVVPPSPSEKPYIIGSKCRSCGESFFPKRVSCAHCSSFDMEEFAFNRIGKLYSFTTIRVKPPHYIGPVPFMMGIVELPEKERVRTLLTDCDQGSLEIGMDMELVIEVVGKSIEPVGKVEKGQDVLGWKFRPVRKQK